MYLLLNYRVFVQGQVDPEMKTVRYQPSPCTSARSQFWYLQALTSICLRIHIQVFHISSSSRLQDHNFFANSYSSSSYHHHHHHPHHYHLRVGVVVGDILLAGARRCGRRVALRHAVTAANMIALMRLQCRVDYGDN